MSNELMAKFEVNGQPVELDANTVRNYLTNGSGKPTDQEVAMFIKLCQYQGLNPFLREAYLIKYSDKNPATTVVGKDAFTRRASEIEDCKGWKAGVCCVNKKSGEYVEREGTIVLPTEDLIGGWCEVKLARWDEPFKQTAMLSEYHQHNSMWNTKTATMIRKVAIVQALREAFPAQFQGMYDQSEMRVNGELPEDEILRDTSEEPITALQKKMLAELLGKDKEKILIAQKVLANYDYASIKDILQGDFENIMEDLRSAFVELENVIDVEPEPEEVLFDDEGLPGVVGEQYGAE